MQSRGFDRNSSVKDKKWPKSSSIGSTLKKALDTGNVQIISNHLVESFEINKLTELASKLTIVNLENGCKEVLNCDLILLCASTISTPVSYTHLRAHETVLDLVCRLLLEKKNSHFHTILRCFHLRSRRV